MTDCIQATIRAISFGEDRMTPSINKYFRKSVAHDYK